MTMEPSELLGRLSSTLRHEVGPAVEGEYTKTQTFMASVILAKLAKQLELQDAHAADERSDVEGLHLKLTTSLAGAPDTVIATADHAKELGTVAALGPVIEALYEWGLEQARGVEALGLIRSVLRRDIDRRMEIAT